MKNKIIASLLFVVFLSTLSIELSAQEKKSAPQPKFHKKFIEHFDKPTSKYFNQNGGRRRQSTQMRYVPATSSFCEKDTKVMRIGTEHLVLEAWVRMIIVEMIPTMQTMVRATLEKMITREMIITIMIVLNNK